MMNYFLNKIISVFLILTLFFESVLFALPSNVHSFQINLSHRDLGFFLEVKSPKNDFDFSDSVSDLDDVSNICHNVHNPLNTYWQKIVQNNSIVYRFNDYDFFKVDLDKGRLSLLAQTLDLMVNIQSDYTVVLCDNHLNALHIKTKENVINEKLIDVKNGSFSCFCKNFINENGRLNAKTIYIDAQSILNKHGVLIANGKIDEEEKSHQGISIITPGIVLVAKKLIDSRYGHLFSTMAELKTNDFILDSIDYTEKKFGLDMRSGVIYADELSIMHNNCPFFLDQTILRIPETIDLNATEIRAELPFFITAKNINIQTRYFSAHLISSSDRFILTCPSQFSYPVLEFGDKTLITSNFLTLQGADKFKPFGVIKGIINIACLILGMHVDLSDACLSAEVCDLRHPLAMLQDTKIHNKKIEKAHIKASDAKVFNGHPHIKEIYMYLQNGTGSLTFHAFKLPVGTLRIIDKYTAENLFISGDIDAKSIFFDSKKCIRDDEQIGTMQSQLRIKSDILSLEAKDASISHSELDIQNLILNTIQTPAVIAQQFSAKTIDVQGAGAVFKVDTTFSALIAKAQILQISGKVQGQSAKIDVQCAIIGELSDQKEKKGETTTFDLQHRLSLNCLKGLVYDAKITAENIDIQSSDPLKILPGCENLDETNIAVKPSLIHAKKDIHLGSVENISSKISAGKKIFVSGNQKHLALASDLKRTSETKEKKDLTWWKWEYLRGSEGYHFDVITETPVVPVIDAPHIFFDSEKAEFESVNINGKIEVKPKNEQYTSAFKKTNKYGRQIDGYVFWSTTRRAHLEECEPLACQVNGETIEDPNAKSIQKKEEYEVINRQLTPLSHCLINIGVFCASGHYGLPTSIVAKLGMKECVFAKYCITSFVNQGTSQLITSGLSYGVGDKNWDAYILSRQSLYSLIVGSLASGAMGEFATRLLGSAYDPYKLPSFWENPTDGWLKISPKQLGLHGIMLLAKEAEYKLIYGNEDGWFTKHFLSRMLMNEISSLSAYYAQSIGKHYSSGKLTYNQHKMAHAFLGLSTELVRYPLRYMFNDNHQKPLYNYLSCILSAGCGAALAEIVAEKIAFKDKTPFELIESYDIEAKVFAVENLDRAALLGKIAGCLPGLLTLNAEALNASFTASVNAVDNNFVIVLGIICFGLTIYDLNHAYKEGGLNGFLKQLGFEIILYASGEVVLKSAGKIIKTLPNIEKAAVYLCKKIPYLEKIIGNSLKVCALLIEEEAKLFCRGLSYIEKKLCINVEKEILKNSTSIIYHSVEDIYLKHAVDHSFEKHLLGCRVGKKPAPKYKKFDGVLEFKCQNIRTKEQLFEHIRSVLNDPSTIKKELSNGRTAYLHPETSTVFIKNVNNPTKNTVFQIQEKDAIKFFNESLK